MKTFVASVGIILCLMKFAMGQCQYSLSQDSIFICESDWYSDTIFLAPELENTGLTAE